MLLVIGIGIDLVEIGRIQAAMDRAGRRFLERVFTPRERLLCNGRAWRLAGRFAAKEALLKAVGTGLRGFTWREIEILADGQGAPAVSCHGGFAAALSARGVSRIHLSISHSRDFAIAQALLEGDGP
ncbi:MAG: holo-ACP synthase [Patescibacteria group bacterium]